MSEEETDHRAYVLRVWRAGDGDQDVWRASLANPYTEEREAFASLDQLVAYLRARCEGTGPPTQGGGCALPGAEARGQWPSDKGDSAPAEGLGAEENHEKEVGSEESDTSSD
jgi:hypothetical protein